MYEYGADTVGTCIQLIDKHNIPRCAEPNYESIRHGYNWFVKLLALMGSDMSHYILVIATVVHAWHAY